MKNGKKPPRSQRIFLKSKRMNAEDWLVCKDTPEKMELVHRHSDKTRKTIYKEHDHERY